MDGESPRQRFSGGEGRKRGKGKKTVCPNGFWDRFKASFLDDKFEILRHDLVNQMRFMRVEETCNVNVQALRLETNAYGGNHYKKSAPCYLPQGGVEMIAHHFLAIKRTGHFPAQYCDISQTTIVSRRVTRPPIRRARSIGLQWDDSCRRALLLFTVVVRDIQKCNTIDFREIHPETPLTSSKNPRVLQISPRLRNPPKDQHAGQTKGLRYFDDLADVVVTGAAVVLLLRKRTRTGIFMGVSDVVRSVHPSVRSSNPEERVPVVLRSSHMWN
ncbi:hypothetical protein EAG_08804 [Camponotus floridanus]|uniref:Uncharacterized protein n=1 Tax=Camponotus floridanus TaxID=104421 RepID=E2AYE0_CAMFO|nr:hypothetical protein EAG_08804 [Camponotus floridanus]